MLNSANVVGLGLSVLRSFVVMRFLDPDSFGIWLGLVVVLSYAGYAHAGLEYGLGNRLPYYRGRGNAPREAAVQDTVYLAWTASSGLVALGLLASAFLVAPASAELRFGLLAVSALVLLDQQVAFLARWHTSARIEFGLLSSMSVVQHVAGFLYVVPLTAWLGVRGVMLGTALTSATMLILWRWRSPYRFAGHLSREVLREMLVVGFPTLVVVVGGVLIQSADRVLVASLLGATALGYYGVTGLGGSVLYGMLVQSGSAMAPHMLRELGEVGDSPQAFEKYLVKPTILLAIAAAALIGALVFVVPVLVRLYLPRYEPGLDAFYWFVPGFFFLGVIASANNIFSGLLIERKRQRIAIGVQFGALLVEIVLGWALIRMGWGIAGVAFASTAAYACYGLSVLYGAALFIIPERRRRWRFLALVLVPLVYGAAAIGAIFAIEPVMPANPLVRVGLKLLLFGSAWLPLLLWLDRYVGVMGEIGGALRRTRARLAPAAWRRA